MKYRILCFGVSFLLFCMYAGYVKMLSKYHIDISFWLESYLGTGFDMQFLILIAMIMAYFMPTVFFMAVSGKFFHESISIRKR